MAQMMKEAEQQTEDLQKEVKQKIDRKQKLTKQIDDINNDIFAKDGAIKKHMDDLEIYKNYKHFLDIMSMQAGLKKYQMNETQQQVITPSGTQKPKGPKGSTFNLTQAATEINTSPTKGASSKQIAIVPPKKDENEEDLLPIEMRIELNDEYHDKDFKIYFDKKALLDHLNHLEDDNLFKIYLVQEDEQKVLKMKEQAEVNYEHLQKEIDESQKSIEQLQKNKDVLIERFNFLNSSINT